MSTWNLLLEWVPTTGPHKGETVSKWFMFADPMIDYLKKYCNAKVIDRA